MIHVVLVEIESKLLRECLVGLTSEPWLLLKINYRKLGSERYRNRHPIPNTLPRNETNTNTGDYVFAIQSLTANACIQYISKQILV